MSPQSSPSFLRGRGLTSISCTYSVSYPLPNQRGLFLSIWVGMRNAGSMVGGIISLANNIKNKGAGAVSRST